MLETKEIAETVYRVSSPASELDYMLLAVSIISALAIVGTVIMACIQSCILKKQADIAKQHNKIALFEKRFEVYLELQKIHNFYMSVKSGYDEPRLQSKYKDEQEEILNRSDVEQFLLSRDIIWMIGNAIESDMLNMFKLELKKSKDNFEKIYLLFGANEANITNLKSIYSSFLDDISTYIAYNYLRDDDLKNNWDMVKNKKWNNPDHAIARENFISACEDIKLDNLLETLRIKIELASCDD